MRTVSDSIIVQTKCNENIIYEKNPVEVYCRIRPPKNQNEPSCIIAQSATNLELIPFEDQKNKFKYQYSFTFKQIFPECTEQNEIFEKVAVPLLKGVLLNGENGLLFSYGVTCSGKSYTMFGEFDKPGIVPRSIYTLFNTINGNQTDKFVIKSDKMNGFEVQTKQEALDEQLKAEKNKKGTTSKTKAGFLNCGRKLDENIDDLTFTVFITYVEIYNNIVYDLLEENTGLNFLQNKILREDCNKNIYVNNANEIEVKSAAEAIQYYCMGSKKKKTAQTVLNNESSRSHSIFTVRVIIQDKCLPGQFKISQLSLVDLAGSERCNRTHSSGLRLKEASCINNSLMSLRHCLEILRENEQNGTRTKKVIPYRESRLTHLFKNYFEGQGKVKMVICVNPSILEHEENFHALKFAEMTQEVKVRCELKLPVIPEIDVKFQEYKQETNTFNTYTATPLLKPSPENNDIKAIVSYLKRRKDKLSKLQVIQAKSINFRNRLFHLQKEKHVLQTQVQYYMPAERQKAEMIKEKFKEIELKCDQMLEKYDEKENIITQLNKCLEEKDIKLNEALIAKHKQRQRLDEVSNKLKNELDIKLQHQKEYLDAQMKEKCNKLELVKDILTETNSNISIQKIKTNINSASKENIPEQTYSRCRSGIPRAQRQTPVSNVRYNRNCGSSKWLEHKTTMPVPLGTVFQPKLKRKKCVTTSSICKEDVINSKRNKYLLISQRTDKEGDLETKFYKGDIIPTCSGGAQVILNDVEKLKHESPL